MIKLLVPQINTVGLVAHYKLWAGFTTTGEVFDYSFGGFEGTVAGTDIAPAYPGFSFNGTDDFIDVGTGPASVKTMSVWVNQADITGSEGILDLNGSDFFATNSGAVSIFGFGTPTLYVDGIVGTSGGTMISAGSWAHLVATTSTAKNATDLDIGLVTTLKYEGDIGEVMLFDRELSAVDVKSVFELTRWRYGV